MHDPDTNPLNAKRMVLFNTEFQPHNIILSTVLH
jgi:hypothetical protein